MAVTYLLIRHGEADGNREHRFIGQTDVPLSDLGRAQAEAVADRLADRPIDAIISSHLQRAWNTVAPLADRLDLTVEENRGLVEIANGEWNGLLPSEVEARWPELWQRYRGGEGEDVRRPGGERWADVQARAIAAIQEDAANRQDGDVVAVGTHGGPTLGLVLWATGVSLDRGLFTGPFLPVSNGSITTLEMPEVRLSGYNDTGHLGDLARRTLTPFDTP